LSSYSGQFASTTPAFSSPSEKGERVADALADHVKENGGAEDWRAKTPTRESGGPAFRPATIHTAWTSQRQDCGNDIYWNIDPPTAGHIQKNPSQASIPDIRQDCLKRREGFPESDTTAYPHIVSLFIWLHRRYEAMMAQINWFRSMCMSIKISALAPERNYLATRVLATTANKYDSRIVSPS